MKITTTLVLFLTIALLGLSACSKEKKMERRLLKKDGVWEITSIRILVYSPDNDSLMNEINYTNSGTLTFHKNGTFDRESVEAGTWINTDDEIILAYKENTYYGPNVFTVIKQTKDEMTLQSVSRLPDIVVYKNVTTYQLKRKK